MELTASGSGGGSAARRLGARALGLLPRGALLLSVLTFGSYVMGLVRDRAFARTFGAGLELDTYNAALVLPELVLDVLVVAGLSSAFVPLYTRSRREGAAAAHEFGRTVLTVAIVVMAIAAVILFIIAPWTIELVAPGFTDPAQRALYVELFRVMCVTSLVFAASFGLGEILVSGQRFLGYGLAPLLYNAGIVAGALVLGPRMGVLGVAVGTVVGALLHLGVRWLDIRRTDFRYRPRLGVRTAEFREYVRLSIPKALSQPIEPLTFLYFTSVASTLAAGSITAVSFARNFQSVPVSLIGVAFSVAAFPVLSAAAAAGERERFGRLVRTNLLTIGVLTTAAGVALAVVASVVIELFLGGEAFEAEDVATTSLILGAFALSVPLESLTHLLSRAIYATRNTLLPVAASIAGLATTVVAVAALTPAEGVVALPLGFAAGQGVKVVVLGVALRHRMARVGSDPG